MNHLLVTNDFPPKVGGIQSYLWELWRRLPADGFGVLTSPYEGAAEFDAAQAFGIDRYDRFWLPPTRRVRSRVKDQIAQRQASAVVLDPAWPLGSIGPGLGLPYAVVLHGAEVTIPARIPVAASQLRRTIGGAALVISSSRFAEGVVRDLIGADFPPVTYVPPGVDTTRFRPLSEHDRQSARRRLGLDPHAPLIVGVSRLVPRKGFDVLIDAAASVAHRHRDLSVVIGGTGRDEKRLRRRIQRSGAPVRLLGYVDDADLADLYGCADGFAMLCRSRWGGLEQEGFGIVFVEAAAAGCPQLAGASGGSAEAVSHGETGWVVDDPTSAVAVAAALNEMIDQRHDPAKRIASRQRAETEFSYDLLASRLEQALTGL